MPGLASISPVEATPQDHPAEGSRRLAALGVRIVISDRKPFLLGTYHGRVQPHRRPVYLGEFVYRFNRHFWEGQIANRLLSLCIEHLPATLRET